MPWEIIRAAGGLRLTKPRHLAWRLWGRFADRHYRRRETAHFGRKKSRRRDHPGPVAPSRSSRFCLPSDRSRNPGSTL